MNKKLRQLMEQNNTTQTELAEVAGVSQAFMSYIMKGYKVPSGAVLKRIADYFGVSMDELVD